MSEMMDPTASDQAKHWVQFAIKAIHYAYPAQAFLYFLLALSITLCTLQTQRLRIQDQHVRRGVILALILVAATTYLAEVITLVVEIFVMLKDEWYPDQDLLVYLIASSITFGAQALALTDSKFPVWYPYYGTWFFGLVVEVFLIVVPNVFDPPKGVFDFLSISIQALRICNFIVLISLYFWLRNDRKTYDNVDAERQSLLRKKLAPKPGSSEDTNGTTKANGYGATNGTTTNANAQDSEATEEASDAGSEDSWIAKQRKAQEAIDKRLQQDGNWFTYAKGFAIFFPYLWPYHSKTLQFRAVLVGFCLLGSNALNVLVPRQMGIMIDSLTKAAGGSSDSNVWIPIIVYTALKFVSGSAGIGWIRRWLWIPLEQYSYDALSTASHSHLMSLSSDFHDNKTSSDLTQAVHGGRSVADLLETVCFQVVPMFIDLTVAFAYLWSLFGPYMGLLMVATVVSYLYITTKLYSLRASKRRDYITIYRKEWTIGQQSLDGWGTASLFNMIPYERHRYACAVKDHMKAKRTYEMSSQAISAAQGLVISLGVLIALWLGAWQVVHGEKSTGQFTTLIFYWAQLQSPLIFFSTMYRQISYSLMDAERLLELFQTKPTIVDAPHAKPLKLGKGLVKFDQVSFAYDERKPTMKNVSFIVPSGKTVALVGETGGGKSTILKLIDRFYDVKSGCISIDDQDIRDVTVESLRENIGVVPQDPMLFNDSIMNNIRYARLSATDKEVYEACKAAAVHDKIMSFPDGYNSKVGDRGVKLSGGEKQRVAIARAILKQPQIILLDEATSAVDTDTEQTIQEGFKTLCQDRTTIIVAHRLSTIMKADHIIVVMSGEIVEEGSHEELIHKKGKYQNLWSKQLFVKPADERSGRCRSRSLQKRDANIINDLTPGRQTTELAKVLKTTPYEEPSKDEAAQDVGRQSDSADDSCVGHKREASKLKPDAPEFVPFRIKAPADLTPQADSKNQESPSKINSKDAAKAQKKQEKDEHKAASLAKKVGKKVGRQVDEPEDANNSTSNDQSAGPSGDQLTEGDTSAAEKSKRRPRFSRRHIARSEPPNQLQIQSDGQQDSDVTAVSSGEGHSLLQAPASQRRRVTAPSDQPTNAQNRNRRSRHWRLQKRAAENAAAGCGSGTNISGEASTDELSSHLAPAPTPKTPQSTT